MNKLNLFLLLLLLVFLGIEFLIAHAVKGIPLWLWLAPVLLGIGMIIGFVWLVYAIGNSIH